MEARQRVKLSLTNRSIGLISTNERAYRKVNRERPAHQKARKAGRPACPQADPSGRITSHPRSGHTGTCAQSPFGRLVDLVVIARGPHPIPSRTRP